MTKPDIDYSKEYPEAWKEGYKRGRKAYMDGFTLSKVSTKNKWSLDFWPSMAFKYGVLDGYCFAQENDTQLYES